MITFNSQRKTALVYLKMCLSSASVCFHFPHQVMILTGEGGKLKRNIPLCRGRDFEVIPEPVWRALQQWYGGGPALPRTVTLQPLSKTLCLRLVFPITMDDSRVTSDWSEYLMRQKVVLDF